MCHRKRRCRYPITAALLVLALWSTVAPLTANGAIWSGNGHDYMVIDSPNTTWNAAAFNKPAGYHLATPNSEAENAFIWSLIVTSSSNTINKEYWLGGFYKPEDDAWYLGNNEGIFWNGIGPYSDLTDWDADRVDGVYENWQTELPNGDPVAPGFIEPNDGNCTTGNCQEGGPYLAMWRWDDHFGWWNDEKRLNNIQGYLVESFEAVPIPGAVILFGSGLAGLFSPADGS